MTMYAILTDDRTNEELARYTLADADILDCDIYAKRYADECEGTLAKETGIVPTGCADFTVTLQEEPGSVRVWTSKSYFFERE